MKYRFNTNDFLYYAQGKEQEYSGFVDVMIMEMKESLSKLPPERRVKAKNMIKVLEFYRHNYAEMFKVINNLKQESAELRRLL